jgi:hypothetical protein
MLLIAAAIAPPLVGLVLLVFAVWVLCRAALRALGNPLGMRDYRQ